MNSSAAVTHPFSYSETCDTFRAAARTASRTCSGRSSFVGLNIRRPVLNSFVAEHRSERGPSCVENGLRHSRLRHGFSVHIADNDSLVFQHDLCRLFVQVMLSGVANLRVESSGTLLVASSLRNGELPLVCSKVFRVINLSAIGQRGKRLQPKINANLAHAAVFCFRDLGLQVEIPPAARVLGKRAAADFSVHRTAIPEAIAVLEKYSRVIVDTDGTSGGEGNPPKRFLPAPSGAPSCLVSGNHELLADCLHGVAVNAEQRSTAGAKLNQIEGARPTFVVTPRGFLNFPAVVPNDVYRPSHHGKVLACCRILDPVLVRQQHTPHIVGLWATCKTFGEEGTAFQRCASTWSLSPNTVVRSLTKPRLSGSPDISQRCATDWERGSTHAMAKTTTCICLSSIRQSSRLRCLSTRSRERPVEGFGKLVQNSRIDIGKASYGRRVISPHQQEELRWKLSSSTWNNKEPPPCHERQGFRLGSIR